MELFLPSLLVLLIAAAVIFYVLPEFAPATLAMISLALLVFGVYQHVNTFGTEYRMSTWQMSFATFTPFIMLGGIFFVIAIYFLFLDSSGKATAVELPSLKNMPSAESATNAITEGVNKGLNKLKDAAASLGLTNNNNNNNNGNVEKKPNTNGNKGNNNRGNNNNNYNNTNGNNNKGNANNNYIKQLLEKMGMNNSKASNNLKKPNISGEPRVVSGLPYPLSQQ